MEKSVAVKKLHKILGKGFGYRVDAKACTKEDREKAKAQLNEALTIRNKATEELEARRQEVLAGDKKYQEKKEAKKAAQAEVDKLSARYHRYPITVGTTMDLGGFGFFEVKAQGDNWQEVLDKVMKK